MKRIGSVGVDSGQLCLRFTRKDIDIYGCVLDASKLFKLVYFYDYKDEFEDTLNPKRKLTDVCFCTYVHIELNKRFAPRRIRISSNPKKPRGYTVTIPWLLGGIRLYARAHSYKEGSTDHVDISGLLEDLHLVWADPCYYPNHEEDKVFAFFEAPVSWYDYCCDRTLGVPGFGLIQEDSDNKDCYFPMSHSAPCFVTRTLHGDGYYGVYEVENKTGGTDIELYLA